MLLFKGGIENWYTQASIVLNTVETMPIVTDPSLLFGLYILLNLPEEIPQYLNQN